MDIKKIIKQMTLEEKASLCSGKNVWQTKDIKRLNIPSIMFADGPHGLRKQKDNNDNLGVNENYNSTCFPTAATVSCSFDRSLLEVMGEAIANECVFHNVDVLLGPGVNIKRSPLCGRNFEYFSEDPFLTGELGASFVLGVQKKGVGTSLKHFAANNQERLRNIISAEIDERALNEIYLYAFERVIKEEPYTVMCSYNKVSGVYSSENKKLLNDILREKWKYEGVLITDWGACNDRVEGLIAGQDIEMPTCYGMNDELIIKAINEGKIEEEILDNTVERILNLVYKCKENKKNYLENDNHELARQIASQSMVLLKNDENILPLKSNKSIAIIGELAKIPRYQGSGSSKISPIKLENVYDCLKEKNIKYHYSRGYDIRSDKPNKLLLQEAIDIASKVDIPILFIGLTEEYESEGFDREHMKLPYSHDLLVREIAQINPNVVVVLSGGAPIEMPWIKNIKALLNSYLSGESGALAIIDILYGDVNPSGKLAETYPLSLEDNPSYKNFPGGNRSVWYKESIYVGYRYYEKANINVLFPFGFGLSYTDFKYDNLNFSKLSISENDELEVKFTIKNIGLYDGSEVCQLYVREYDPKVFKPIKELKGFSKVFLKVNEEKEIKIKLNKESFAFFNVNINDWAVNSNRYEILIGSSSNDIRLKGDIIFKSELDIENSFIVPSYYNLLFKDEDFEKLLGYKLPPLNVKSKRPYTINSSISDIRKTLIGKLFYHFGIKEIKNKTKGESNRLTRLMMQKSFIEMPIRSVISFSGGMFNKEMTEGLLLMINGKYLRGIKKFLKAKRINNK